jgi:hypothetical protein
MVFNKWLGGTLNETCFSSASTNGDFVSNSNPLVNTPLNTFQVLVLFLPHQFRWSFALGCVHVRWGCLPCRFIFEGSRCRSSFWDPFLMFHTKTFLSTPFLFSFTICLTLVHLFWHDAHANFWVFLGIRLFGLPTSPFNVSLGFLPHFWWAEQLHFCRIHCVTNLFWELGICCTYHHH